MPGSTRFSVYFENKEVWISCFRNSKKVPRSAQKPINTAMKISNLQLEKEEIIKCVVTM